jgi:TPR repeat protein
MRIRRMTCALWVAFAVQSAHAADFNSLERGADLVDQQLYDAATQRESPSAMYALGVECEEESNSTAAFRWFKLAAALGHGESMRHIGDMYATGHGLPQDYVAAGAWYERAVQHAAVEAASSLATLYFYGFGVPQSYRRAAELLGSAARRGNAEAQEKLAVMYESGVGLTRSPRRARALYERSVAQGYAPAMVDLGLMYIEAIGVPRNDVQGYALVTAGVVIGIPDEMAKLASNEISVASDRLDRLQMADAQRLARTLVNAASEDKIF